MSDSLLACYIGMVLETVKGWEEMPPFFPLEILKKTPLCLGYFFYLLRLLLGTYFKVIKQEYLLYAPQAWPLHGGVPLK